MFGFDNDTHILGHEPATIEAVNAYEAREGPGPNINDLQIALKGPINSRWNNELTRILIDLLRISANNGDWELPSDNYLALVIKQKITTLRTLWNQADEKIEESSGRREDPKDALLRFSQQRKVKAMRDRRCNRRVTVCVHVYGNRMELTFYL